MRADLKVTVIVGGKRVATYITERVEIEEFSIDFQALEHKDGHFVYGPVMSIPYRENQTIAITPEY